LANFLRASGHRVEITQDTRVLLEDGERDFDAVVFNTEYQAESINITDDLVDPYRFICAGKGYYCIHLADCRLEDWQEYNDMNGEKSLWRSTKIPPHGPFAPEIYPSGRSCIQGIASFVTIGDLFGYGPVGYLGHIVAFTIEDHAHCRRDNQIL
jgi:hypothetical protein